MTLSREDIERTIGPLVYGVADQDGVTKAVVDYIQQIRRAERIDENEASYQNALILPSADAITRSLAQRGKVLRREG
jgi:hypothetical protein